MVRVAVIMKKTVLIWLNLRKCVTVGNTTKKIRKSKEEVKKVTH